MDNLEENQLANLDGFNIEPCKVNLDFGDTKRFKKLDYGKNAAAHISALVQSVPAFAAIAASNDIYVATFPAGVPHVLDKFKDGSGYYTGIHNPADGQYVAHARLNHPRDYAPVVAAFTVMSVITSQYYLSAINSKLTTIQLGIDKILDFLYGEKSSELMAEVSFVKSAYKNYSSIMAHPEQRQATIHSLQDAKKVAMKDLEFYISELDKIQSNNSEKYVQDAVRVKNCIELSEQLYVLSGILKVLPGHKVGDDTKQAVNDILDELTDGTESVLKKTLTDSLHTFEQPVKIYVNRDGDAYMEQTAND